MSATEESREMRAAKETRRLLHEQTLRDRKSVV